MIRNISKKKKSRVCPKCLKVRNEARTMVLIDNELKIFDNDVNYDVVEVKFRVFKCDHPDCLHYEFVKI